MSILAELLAPMTEEDFRRRTLFREPYAAPNKALRFRRLVNWEMLSDILDSGHGDCWLPKEGRLPADKSLSRGTLSLAEAQRGFHEGRTLLIRHAERAHAALASIAGDFHETFRMPIDIQLYATPAGEEGFDWHYDVEDVFVLQTSGSKEFRLRANTHGRSRLTVKPPSREDFESQSSGQEMRCLLQGGDWLYIPAGTWHKARALSPSFHLSVGVLFPRDVGSLPMNPTAPAHGVQA